ncbi:MAG: fibronectin type III domain-containing protein [Thermodesulfovibrionales bacterium]
MKRAIRFLRCLDIIEQAKLKAALLLMYKKLIIILVVSFSIISFSNLAWSSVVGTWEIEGKTTTTIKVKGIKTKKVVEKLDDVWTFNSDNSFESENIVGTWSQKKTKVTVYLNDNDIIQYYGGTQNEELGTNVTVDKITKKTCTGTENTKKRTIKGSFKIYMNITVYDDICHCNRTGKVTFVGSYTGILDKTPPSIPTGLTANAVSTSQINLSWNASSDNVGVTGYKIYRNGSYLKSINSTSTTDIGLSSSTQYCYTVSAYDVAMNESNQSSQACATTNPVDEILAKTELLKGKWHFIFIIISTFTYDYTLTTIDGDKNDQGGYYISGTDEWGDLVIAGYWPDDGNWALLDTGTIIDRFFVFYTDGSNILSNSCYYQIDSSTGSFSRCYELSGYKYSAATALNKTSTRKNNKIGILIKESIMIDEVETITVDEFIEMKYQELKYINKNIVHLE